jgi:solute carrier family 6 amino acid/orphan transporter-like 15/16/17/18/20/solute carrier family 6 (neurotransmitter transporter) protein 19
VVVSSEAYFYNYVLDETGHSWEDYGKLDWRLIGCLFGAWLLACLCLRLGIQTTGKVVYFTSLYVPPYVDKLGR